jgi:hypothetical protein
MKGKFSASTAIEDMRLGRRFNDALLPLDASIRRIGRDEFERLFIEKGFSPYRPQAEARHSHYRWSVARAYAVIRKICLVGSIGLSRRRHFNPSMYATLSRGVTAAAAFVRRKSRARDEE